MTADFGREGGPGYGWPPADTGNIILDRISDAANALIHWERRVDPFFRPWLDGLLRDPATRALTNAVNARRRDEGLALAEERHLPDEEAIIDQIIATFTAQMRRLWNPRYFQRGGNTKTHALVRGEVAVRSDVPEHMRHGILAEPRTYPAWIRYSGPGPYWSADIDDIGFLSMAIKMMGVPGPKLLDDEKFTQDLFGTCAPSFVTPDIRANAHLQEWSYKNAGLFYFANPREPHLLDALMNFLWTKTQTSPLECDYFSTVPYLLGDGQAMQYAFRPRARARTPVPNLPGRPPDNYLRDAMVTALQAGDVEFDLLVQLQTDPFLMPIENAAVVWPERLSPRVPVATIRIPRQTFASQEQIAFASVLAYNPWHCVPEHRPLGNVNRARRRLYAAVSQLRMQVNGLRHYEPTGDETFPGFRLPTAAP